MPGGGGIRALRIAATSYAASVFSRTENRTVGGLYTLADIRWEIRRSDLIFCAQHQGASDHVFQLPHISGPSVPPVPLEALEGFKKATLPDLLFQIPVCSRDDSHISGMAFNTTHRPDFIFLEQPKEFCLNRGRELTDFV